MTEAPADGATPITADLLADTEPRIDEDQQSLAEDGESTRVSQSVERRTLPDGRYRYEVVFTGTTGERRVHTGLFYVQGGSTVSREAMRSRLGSTASELAATRAARAAATTGDQATPPRRAGARSRIATPRRLPRGPT